MLLWILVLTLIAAAALIGMIYLIAAVSRFDQINKIERKWKRYSLSFLIIAVGFVFVMQMMSLVNAIIVFLHVFAFFLIYDLIFKLIKVRLDRSFRVNWQGWLALFTSVVYLCIGYYLCVHVWQTDYQFTTNKDVDGVRIAMFADAHVSTTFDGDGFAEHMRTIEEQGKPDIVLIPGDYVDDWTKREDMVKACEALGKMDAKYGVWYAYGNHDKGFFDDRDFTAEDLEQELLKNHVHVLEDEVGYAGNLCIVGRSDEALGERKELSELLEGVDRDKYIIVMDHEPEDFEPEAKTDADLVVCGHTHGGQLFPINKVAEWFGVSDRTYGHENREGTDFVVTSGIADWEILFKTGTKSEYVIIELKNN